jgi:biopolymer transport protein TolR
MKKRHRTKTQPLAAINVVPYIDVMLVLLVIFMITAPLLTQGITVKLPTTSAKPLPQKHTLPIVVSVDQQGLYYLNVADLPKAPIDQQTLYYRIAALLKLAKERHQHREIYVKGDTNVNYGKVVQAMTLLQHAGADHVGLITKPKPAPPSS